MLGNPGPTIGDYLVDRADVLGRLAMHRHEDDRDLVLAARAGDKAAFAALLARHWSLLLALCRRALSDPVRAEDAVQEAALQALLGLDRLRQPDRFGAWLAGIGLNVCRRWRQQQAGVSWEAFCGGRQVAEPVDWQPSPDERAEAAELARTVHQAIASLPPGQRTAVLHFYLAGLTHAETATALGIEIGAVKTRLHKARVTLRRQLAGYWQEETMTTIASDLGEARVADVRRVPAAGDRPARHLVVLEEVGGAGRLPIWIGAFEATALALTLEKVAMPRPMTYTLMAGLLDALGGRLREVRISRLAEEVFYAEVLAEGAAGAGTVDARPSDALNLALLAGVPIRVAPAIFAVRNEAPPLAAADRDYALFFGEGSVGAAAIAAGSRC